MIDRYHGALLGLAAGDALGTTLEFTPRRAVTPISDMAGGGPFGLRPGPLHPRRLGAAARSGSTRP
jgi:ADP-ribosyl-[dinitrogen reductase] hydrolase